MNSSEVCVVPGPIFAWKRVSTWYSTSSKFHVVVAHVALNAIASSSDSNVFFMIKSICCHKDKWFLGKMLINRRFFNVVLY